MKNLFIVFTFISFVFFTQTVFSQESPIKLYEGDNIKLKTLSPQQVNKMIVKGKTPISNIEKILGKPIQILKDEDKKDGTKIWDYSYFYETIDKPYITPHLFYLRLWVRNGIIRDYSYEYDGGGRGSIITRGKNFKGKIKYLKTEEGDFERQGYYFHFNKPVKFKLPGWDEYNDYYTIYLGENKNDLKDTTPEFRKCVDDFKYKGTIEISCDRFHIGESLDFEPDQSCKCKRVK